MKEIDLRHAPIPKLFFTYFIPSFFTMMALSTYSTIDGIFVGRKLGNDALAAIGIAWPVFPLMIAMELLLSFGGATLSSYYLGKGRPKEARLIFSSVFYFIVCISVSASLFCYVYVEHIALWLGASPHLKGYVIDYLSVIFLGMSFILLHPLIDVFVVNDRRPVLATISMIVGALSNIVLNYYFMFILEWGIKGSAWATILAHCIGFMMIFQHFIRKKGDLYFVRGFSIKRVFMAAKTGIPQASAEVSASIVMFLFNFHLLSIAFERGVAIYAIMMYSGIVVFTVLFAVSQGLQPIASFSYGAGQFMRTKSIFRFSLMVVVCVGVVLYALSSVFAEFLAHLFLDGDVTLIDDVARAIRIYYIGYIFLGVNILSAVFLQSIQSTLSSFILTLFYTIIFIVFLLPIFKHYFGIDGIWASYPVAQFLSLFVVFIVLRLGKVKLRMENAKR